MKQNQTANLPRKNGKLFLIKSSSNNKNNKNVISNKSNNDMIIITMIMTIVTIRFNLNNELNK